MYNRQGGTGRRLEVITYLEIALRPLPPTRRTGSPSMRRGAGRKIDPKVEKEPSFRGLQMAVTVLATPLL